VTAHDDAETPGSDSGTTSPITSFCRSVHSNWMACASAIEGQPKCACRGADHLGIFSRHLLAAGLEAPVKRILCMTPQSRSQSGSSKQRAETEQGAELADESQGRWRCLPFPAPVPVPSQQRAPFDVRKHLVRRTAPRCGAACCRDPGGRGSGFSGRANPCRSGSSGSATPDLPVK
jgi:hypothetical protein